MLHKVIRRVFSRIPFVYELGAAVRLVWLKLTYSGGGAISALKLVNKEQGLALDIGGNRGQSAIRMLKLKPHFQVLSFEPNKKCILCLNITKLMLGSSFRYELYGISDVSGEMPYYEPCVNSLAVSAEGTFCPENLDDSLEERIGLYDVRKSTFPVRTIDELNLAPLFIKIDVQGAELAVLRGARKTIIRCRPIIVVEQNIHNEESVKSYLSDLGYVLLNTNSSTTATELGVTLADLCGDNVFVCKLDSSASLGTITASATVDTSR